MTGDKANFSCLACAGETFAEHSRGCRDLWCDAAAVVDYARCKTCGLVQQHPPPDDISPFYEGYPIHEDKPRWYGIIRAAVNKDVYYRAPNIAGRRAQGCDYGCGDGNFLSTTTEQANVECCGFEYSAEHARRLSEKLGAPVYSDMNALAEKARACGGFDFVSMHNVLEHLPDPTGTLRELAAMLRPGGEVYAATPSLQSLEARIFGSKFSGIDAPRHICYPEKEHYIRMAEQCGLRLRRCRRARFAPSLAGSLSIALTGRLRGGFFNLMMPGAWALSFVLPGALLAAWMEKPKAD